MTLDEEVEKQLFAFEGQRKNFKKKLSGLALDASKSTPELANIVREQLYSQIKGDYLHIGNNAVPQALLTLYIPDFRQLSQAIESARDGEKVDMDKLAEKLTEQVGNTAASLVLQSLSKYDPITEGRPVVKKLLGDTTVAGYSGAQVNTLLGKLKTTQDIQDVANNAFRSRMGYIRGVQGTFEDYGV